MKERVILFLLWLFPLMSNAQLTDTGLETLMESSVENSDQDEIVQQLSQLRLHPLNINTAGMEELSVPGLFKLPQAEEIVQRKKLYGPFIAFEELQSIEGLTMQDLYRLKNYIVVRPAVNSNEWKPGKILTSGKHILLFRSKINTGTTKNNTYQGDAFSQSFSWRYSKSSLIDVGINGDKDPGEAYLRNSGIRVLDSWNYHLFLRPGGHIKSIAIGDYQVNCGQGLVAWSGFAGSKGPDVINVRKISETIKPYASFGEYINYRGAAVSLTFNRCLASVWFSNKMHDSDIEGNYFRTISASGLHRTTSEIENRGNLKRTIFGLNIKYKGKLWTHEFTFQQYHYNAKKITDKIPYKVFESEGAVFYNAGYGYYGIFRNFSIAGEIAADHSRKTALVNSLLYTPHSRITISVVTRLLPPGYASLSADPFRENSRPENETGHYTGILWQFTQKLKCSAYVDYFSFPWLKYGVNFPSSGKDWLVQLNYTPSRNSELYIRLRKKKVQEQVNNLKADLTETGKLNLRADAKLKLNRNLFFQSRVEWVNVRISEEVLSEGWLLFNELDLKPMGKPWSITLRSTAFSTANYLSRVYAYEQDLPGSYSMPAYYGSGTSFYVLFRIKLLKGLDAWFRLGTESALNYESVRLWSPGIQLRWIFD